MKIPTRLLTVSVVCLLTLLSLVRIGCADSITVQSSVVLSASDGVDFSTNVTCSIPKFDPALGTLLSVLIQCEHSVEGFGTYANTSTNSVNIILEIGGGMTSLGTPWGSGSVASGTGISAFTALAGNESDSVGRGWGRTSQSGLDFIADTNMEAAIGNGFWSLTSDLYVIDAALDDTTNPEEGVFIETGVVVLSPWTTEAKTTFFITYEYDPNP